MKTRLHLVVAIAAALAIAWPCAAPAAVDHRALPTRLIGVHDATQLVSVISSGYGATTATVRAFAKRGGAWHQVFGPWRADIRDGVYVTELIGHGVNGVTGDYSRGASGYRIVNGELAGPVAEFTIAGNLLDMFAALTPADDLEWFRPINVPTIRVDGMTIAGD